MFISLNRFKRPRHAANRFNMFNRYYADFAAAFGTGQTYFWTKEGRTKDRTTDKTTDRITDRTTYRTTDRAMDLQKEGEKSLVAAIKNAPKWSSNG